MYVDLAFPHKSSHSVIDHIAKISIFTFGCVICVHFVL